MRALWETRTGAPHCQSRFRQQIAAIRQAVHDAVTYIVRSVLGGGDGGFSHVQFHCLDHDHGENVLRDLCEYELDLPPAAVEFIAAHAVAALALAQHVALLDTLLDYYPFIGNPLDRAPVSLRRDHAGVLAARLALDPGPRQRRSAADG